MGFLSISPLFGSVPRPLVWVAYGFTLVSPLLVTIPWPPCLGSLWVAFGSPLLSLIFWVTYEFALDPSSFSHRSPAPFSGLLWISSFGHRFQPLVGVTYGYFWISPLLFSN